MGAVLASRYHILRPLGSGGFGETFLARDSHLPGQPICVVKQLKPAFVTSEQSFLVAQRLFNQEAEILYRLGNHDQIPRLLAHFQQENKFYLVQEFIAGWSLDQELRHRKRLNQGEVVALLSDLLQVLAFVHGQRVIHRDIKPSNLIRRQSDHRIVLIDFGAVKQVSSQPIPSMGQTSFTIAVGSPGYMPAEQQSSAPRFSSDIYAVGMVALQALTDISPKDLPRQDETGEISCSLLDLDLHPSLAAILDTMVRYDYRQRYPNASEALRALETVSHLATPLSELPVLPDLLAAPLDTQPQPAEADTQTQPPTPPASAVGLISTQVNPSPVGTPFGTPSRSAASRLRAPFSRQTYRNRQALLSKVKNYWVKGVLETSLHDQVAIELGLETRPDAVNAPWNVALELSQSSITTLPHGTQLISVFDQLGTGRTLLILGEPGAGKTTSLLQLARDLIARAEQDATHLIPVVLNLSSWGGERPIADWIVAELTTKYQIPPKIGKPWVERQQLLLLLDGLDEVPPAHRDACVVALNAFQQQYSTEMIVCSRIKDYEALAHRLDFQGAIYLRSLSAAQVRQYLDSLSTDLTGLRTILAADLALQELAQSPLMLNIMVLAYQGIAAEDLLENLLVEERRRQLFNAYIERMFKRRRSGPAYSEAQAIGWLSWLARRLMQQSQSVFLIEQLQPDWLASRQQQMRYRLGVACMGGLMGGVVGLLTGILTNGLIDDWRSGLLKGAINSIVFGVVFALIFGLNTPEVQTVETLKWSWREVGKHLLIGWKNGIPLGLIGGLLFGIGAEVMPQLTPEPVQDLIGSGLLLGLISGLAAGMVGGLTYGLTGGLRGSSIETKTKPNQGMRRTALSAAIGGVIGGVTVALLIGLGYGSLLGPGYGIMYGLSYGLLGGLLAGFLFAGGQACVKHWVLRRQLYRQGNIPWDYSQFLDEMTARVFLQKVGGGYIFIHRLLMEHFARLGDPKENRSQAG
ncbi:MAG: protein kinase [Synechococcales cyanobacterium M58_A2018_015]|nr:protein kinase [Synechococcales cyanobacterium M58_A2018_015]